MWVEGVKNNFDCNIFIDTMHSLSSILGSQLRVEIGIQTKLNKVNFEE